jgi:phosphatidate cytidylyltransferase
MRQRLISAAVLVPVVVIIFLFGDPWLTLGIVVLAGLAAYETSRLVTAAGMRADPWFAVSAAVTATFGIRVALWSGFPGPPSYVLVGEALAFVALVIVFAGAIAVRHHDPHTGFMGWAGNVIAALYPSLLAFVVGILAVGPSVPDSFLHDRLDGGRVWLLVLVLTVWAFDSFAYVAGRYHGRGRFMNHISPNKTWSGVVGGTAAALLVCTYLSWAAGLEPLAGLALGVAIAVSAQAGDLAESMLKRAAGAKDSGAIIPGHGGILDRVDSFLFAAPVLFLALVWAGPAMYL